MSQVIGVHSFNNCMVLGEHWGRSAEAARPVDVLKSTSRPSGMGSRQAVVMARAGSVNTLGCGGHL